MKADLTKLRLFLEAQLCLSEVIRKRADQAAQRDRDRENRHFWIEIGLTILIVILIGVELYFSIHYGRLGLSEGRQQAAILQHMYKNTEDTAVQIQRAADAMTATLQVLQADRADRLVQAAKRPKLALDVGHIRLDKPHGPLEPRQNTDTTATFDLVLRNAGEATANNITWRILVPPDIGVRGGTKGPAHGHRGSTKHLVLPRNNPQFRISRLQAVCSDRFLPRRDLNAGGNRSHKIFVQVPTNICLWATISPNLTAIESAICGQRGGKVFGQPRSRPLAGRGFQELTS